MSTKNKVLYEFGLSAIAVRNALTGEYIFSAEDVLSAEYTDDVEIKQADAGGSNRYSRDAQLGEGSASCNIEFNGMPIGLIQALKGVALTETSGDSSGFIDSTVTNKIGTSVGTSITGLAIAASGETLLPFGEVTIVAKSSTTVDIYSSDRENKLAEDLTIATGANTLTAFGITLTGHSSISFTTGDQATFAVRPKSTERFSQSYTGNEDVNEVEIIITGQERTTGEQSTLTIYRAIKGGMPFAKTAKEHDKYPVEFTVLQPISGNMVKFESIKKSTS